MKFVTKFGEESREVKNIMREREGAARDVTMIVVA